MGIAALVLGIVATVLGAIGLGFPIGTITGIVGIILGALGRKTPEKAAISTAGLVCSIIGLILSILFWVLCVACAGAISAAGGFA